MPTAPFEPIPDSTQVHVDRLLGARVGEHQVLERVGEGRLGTIYRGHSSATGRQVTLQVLRAELSGNDEEARAANAIKCPGVAMVLGFGQVPDGRRYRVMEALEGESLDALLQRRGRLPPQETALILDQVIVVLQAAHAWAVVHGSLGPSSVYLAGGSVKLIDFGLAKQRVDPQDDLRALGALGFTLLTGEELRDGAPPPPTDLIPEPLARLLRELMERRQVDATSARKELAAVSVQLDSPRSAGAAAPKRSRRGLAVAAFAALALAAAAGAVFAWPAEPQPPTAPAPAPAPAVALSPLEPEDELELEALEEEPPELPPEEPTRPGPRPPRPPPRGPRPVPTAKALYEQTSKLESLLRKQARPGDDVEQALFVLNKQRLRLAGDPSVQDRKDVARQLAGWRRSYLRR